MVATHWLCGRGEALRGGGSRCERGRAGAHADALQRMATDRRSFQAADEGSDDEFGFAARAAARRSAESGRSSGGGGSRRTSTTQSRRSSFALERASLEANRSSLEAFNLQAASRHAPPSTPPVRGPAAARPGVALEAALHCSPLLLGCALALDTLTLWTMCLQCVKLQPSCGQPGREASRSAAAAACVWHGRAACADEAGRAAQDIAELGEPEDAAALCERLGVPGPLRPRFLALAVVPPDTPLPMAALAHLWRLGSLADAEATANLLEAQARPAALAGRAIGRRRPAGFAEAEGVGGFLFPRGQGCAAGCCWRRGACRCWTTGRCCWWSCRCIWRVPVTTLSAVPQWRGAPHLWHELLAGE